MGHKDKKPIPGFEGYFADREGNIYSQWTTRGINKKKMNKRKPCRASNNYLLLSFRVAKKTYYNTGVHRMICLTFNGPCPDGFECSHLDGNRENNRPENLIWESSSDNHKRKIEHGTHDRGYHNKRAKINKQQLEEIRELLEKKMTHKEIGKKFGVSRLFITKIKNGHRYKGL